MRKAQKKRKKLKLLAIMLQIALGVFIIIPSISFLLHYNTCNQYFEAHLGKNTYVVMKYDYAFNNISFTEQEIQMLSKLPEVQDSLIHYTCKGENKEQVILKALIEKQWLMTEMIDQTRIKLVDVHYTDFFNQKVISGRQFTKEDISQKNRVLMVSEQAAKVLLHTEDVIGKEIDLGDAGLYTIIGVMESGYKGFNFDSPTIDFYFPYTCFIGENEKKIDSLIVKGNAASNNEEEMSRLKKRVQGENANTLIGVNGYVKSMVGNLEYFRVNAYMSLIFGAILLLIALGGNVGIALSQFYRRLKIYGTEIDAGAGFPIETAIIASIITLLLASISSLLIVIKLYRYSLVEIMK